MSCEDGDMCVICFDNIEYDDTIIVKLKCNHVYHIECILTYLSYKNNIYNHTCPLCKNYIYRYDIDDMISYYEKYTKNDYEKIICELIKLKVDRMLFCIKQKIIGQNGELKNELLIRNEKINNLLETYTKKKNSFKLLKIIKKNISF